MCVDATDDDRFEMVSGDRDLIQLVRDPSVRLLFTVRGVSELLEFDEATVLAKYGVPASRYAEFAILRGDPSDELPGVKGVGEKTALRAGPDVRLARRAARRRRERHAEAGAAQGEARRSARGSAMREDYLAAMRQLVPIEVALPGRGLGRNARRRRAPCARR